VQPTTPEIIKLTSARKLRSFHSDSNSIGRISTGTSNVTTVNATIGKAIAHGTSGARRVFAWGFPRKTSRNTRTKPKAVTALTKRKGMTRRGASNQKALIPSLIAQKPPRGKSPIRPTIPTAKAVLVAGIFDHKPPNSAKFWLLVLKITPPMLMNIRALAQAWATSKITPISARCIPTAINTKPM